MTNVHQFPPLAERISQNEDLIEGKKIKKRSVVNKLNAINFKGGSLLVKLRHAKYRQTVIRSVRPLPCLGDELVCEWEQPADIQNNIESYELVDILVPDGSNLILVKSDSIGINDDGIRVKLPEISLSVGLRKVQRYSCKDVRARIIQDSACLTGLLVEFSPMTFVIEVDTSPLQTFQWFNPEKPLNVMFFDESQTFYSGGCRLAKQIEGRTSNRLILEPTEKQVRRFKPKEFRSKRQQLLPLPNFVFKHPLTQNLVSLKVFDISGTGFCVEENINHTVLLPGMIINKAELDFAGSFSIPCSVQVVYRKKEEETSEREPFLKCGLAILNMDIEAHRKLLAFLQQADEQHAHLGGPLDMDALWDFFFESGFIYPQKYNFFVENRDNIKEIYQRLYTSNPTIARHFTYQDKGRILGHMAILRFYNKSWLIQHHAATVSVSPRAGRTVLNQIGRFINDSHRLHSANMNFVFCYYRPDNRFPERVFGGVCRGISNPRGCSLDTFNYVHYRFQKSNGFESRNGWALTETGPDDLKELAYFYEFLSSGLMLAGLELEPDLMDQKDIDEEYNRLGFKRKRYLYSLKKNGRLKAIIMANLSDIGLNLSDLTRCIQVFVLEPDDLPRDIFYNALETQAESFGTEEVPVMVYPAAYFESQGIPFEKNYNLWVLNMKNTDDYFRELKKLFKNIDS